MADDKLTADELAEADKLTPEELGGGHASKYPKPRSETADDQSLGLATPIVDIDQPMIKRLVGEILGKPSGYGPEMERMKRGEQNEAANEVVRQAPLTAAGALGGMAAGAGLAAMGARAAPKAIPALTGTLAEMRAASPLAPVAEKAAKSTFQTVIDQARSAIGHATQNAAIGASLGAMGHHSLGATVTGAVVGAATKPVINAIAKYAPGTVKAVTETAAKAAPAVGMAVGNEAAQSPMFNMVDRLRSSTSPRAAELYAKIQALKSPDLAGAGTGKVTQGPAGAMP